MPRFPSRLALRPSRPSAWAGFLMCAAALGASPLYAQQENIEQPASLDFSREVTELPELPSQDHCHQLVELSAPDDPDMAFDRCISLEEKAYNELVVNFTDYESERRTMCTNLALGMEMGYMGLNHCLNFF